VKHKSYVTPSPISTYVLGVLSRRAGGKLALDREKKRKREKAGEMWASQSRDCIPVRRTGGIYFFIFSRSESGRSALLFTRRAARALRKEEKKGKGKKKMEQIARCTSHNDTPRDAEDREMLIRACMETIERHARAPSPCQAFINKFQ